jgi:hypothetical protein
MAITNHERVGKALELLKSGLGPFVERRFRGLPDRRRRQGITVRIYSHLRQEAAQAGMRLLESEE